MNRVRNWDHALAIWAADMVGRPFEWGKTDCVALIRQGLAAMYGGEVYPDLPQWDSKASALRLLAQHHIPIMLIDRGAELLARPYATDGDIYLDDEIHENDVAGSSGIFVTGRVLATFLDHGPELVKPETLPNHAVLRMPYVLR